VASNPKTTKAAAASAAALRHGCADGPATSDTLLTAHHRGRWPNGSTRPL